MRQLSPAPSPLVTGVEFVEFVEIEADFLINNFRELEVTLESPSGAVSVIAQSNAGPYARPVWSLFFLFLLPK